MNARSPVADLEDAEPEVDEPEQVEDDEAEVIEEVRLRAVREDDEAVQVDPDRVAQVHDVLRAEHALAMRRGGGRHLHEEDALDDDGDDDEADPQHRARLDGARGDGAREGVLRSSKAGGATFISVMELKQRKV